MCCSELITQICSWTEKRLCLVSFGQTFLHSLALEVTTLANYSLTIIGYITVKCSVDTRGAQ